MKSKKFLVVIAFLGIVYSSFSDSHIHERHQNFGTTCTSIRIDGINHTPSSSTSSVVPHPDYPNTPLQVCFLGHGNPTDLHPELSNVVPKDSSLPIAGCPEGQSQVSINATDYFCSPSPLATPVNNGSSNHNTCNPVNIATGNKFFTVQQFAGNNINALLSNLFYNANTSEKSWTQSYQQVLLIQSDQIHVLRDNGSIIVFTLQNNNFVTQSQRVETLTFANNIYTLRLSDNTLETYNTAGQLLSIQYPSGITHNISYSNNNNTITVTRLNETLILDLVDGNVVKATLPDNSEINYTWDTSGTIDNLTQVTYADGSTKTYLYENTSFPHYVTGILDENNHRISSVEYDTQGRAISSEVGTQNSGINRTQIQYHTDGTRTVTNSLGKQNTYHFTQFNGEYKITQVEGHASANCAAANQNYTYDANGFMASKTDWEGNVTTYVHNSRGLETSRVEASGTPQARTITTEWHPTFNLRTKITEPERETVFVYDDQGRLISQEVTPR